MRKIKAVLLLIAIGLIVWLVTRQIIPFKLTADMGADGYVKRYTVDNRHPIFLSVRKYSSESARLLSRVEESDLLSMRCSDQMVRTDQGVYILKHLKTQERHKRRVTNKDFIEYMRTFESKLPSGKKILTVRVCETDEKNMFILYSIGVYEKKMADNASIHQVIYNSKENETYVRVFGNGLIPPVKTYQIESSVNHVVCNELFQFTHDNRLIFLCSEESAAGSDHRLYSIDLGNGGKEILGECKNGYPPKLGTTCD